MLIVGERINTSRKQVAEAARHRNIIPIWDEARMQAAAGAHFLDVNAGTFAEREIENLKWIIKSVRQANDLPLCIDSTDPKVIAEGLSMCGRGMMVNSITAEKENYTAMLPLIREYECRTVALCLDDNGIPGGFEDKLKVGFGLVDNLLSDGVPLDHVYVDPLIMAVSTDQRSGAVALQVIHEIKRRYPGIHTICGLSNISFGLPARRMMNRVFLVAAMAAGLDAVIIDPLDRQMMANLITARAVLGNDEYCMAYISAYREKKLEPNDKHLP
ncbi:MAG: methyltetrahydrofolate cobalamin methyltransferase [Candidatus Abyssobacteria bacterium SURF_5]|uniref:Methyltetrahydrofolate cobalamin methyltransferase n=1 Tax=Abyssobacteria bacterium (strain SURF_5) TaxID=2093360 RepID=A0A3A4N0G2_ABYX5|nr:MAG: methyltetrahydrofolate cobalamin methyltransferase [Candidatus Abyssubacteria bacterium SURF_5]